MDRLGRRPEDALTLVRSRISLALLAATMIVAGLLRFDALGRPSYWLDEILGDQLTTRASSEPWWRWVAGLEREHGPLYYATQLAARAAGHDEAAGRLPAVLFGLATIPLIWIAARRTAVSAAGSAVACAALLATSPLHVYYSREARPYALLMMLTAALLVLLLRPTRFAALVLVIAAMLYTTAVAAPVVAAAAATAAVDALLTRESALRRQRWVTAALAAAAMPLFPALYRGRAAAAGAITGFPALDADFFGRLAREFTVSARGSAGHGHTVAVLLILSAIGIVVLARRDRHSAIVVVGMTLLPAGFAIGSLGAFGHWFSVRYVSPALIGFIVLAGVGAGAVGELVAVPLRRRGIAAADAVGILVALAIAAAAGKETWSAARTEAFEKLDWRAIGRTMAHHLRPGDIVLTAEPWSDVALRYYLRPLPPGVRVASVISVPMAEILTQSWPAAWLVTAGYGGPAAVRGWTCRYPLVLAGALENFRLHYAPSAADFLARHASAADLRALASSMNAHAFTLRMGIGDDVLLRAGWGTSEGRAPDTFRWAVSQEASLLIPAYGARDRVIRIHALPFAPSSASPQRVRLLLNGKSLGEATMRGGWADYAFTAPAAFWVDGLNTLLFTFVHAIAPADLFASSADRRQLAACFESISVSEAGTQGSSSADARPVATVRLASDELLEVKGVARGSRTLFPRDRLNRETVEGLLGRVGFDPQTAWPRIARGELNLDDFVTTFAYGTDCEDDETFLQRAFAAVVQRQPNSVEQRDLLARLRAGAPRAHIVNRILNAADLRARLLR